METTSQTEIAVSYVMTEQSIAAYVQYEIDRGASPRTISNSKRVTQSLFEWLPEDKTITKELLQEWRQQLKEHGYTQQTELNYVKGINRYLDFCGFSKIRFNRGKAKDIAGKQFGYLTAIEPTGEKHRKDYVWRCVCRCGKEVEYPATRLLTGNTLSCGCLLGEHFKEVNKYIDGTSLRQSMTEQVVSTHAASGYTGVMMKRGKWQAYITYKRQRVYLGCFAKLEDAVKARARGKELVKLDAMGLLDFYEELHKDDPPRPNRLQVKQEHKQLEPDTPSSNIRAIRSNNTSGHPGVFRKREKWAARITYQKVTYHLGVYDDLNGAVAARQAAEHYLNNDPEQFLQWVLHSRKEVTET